MMSRSDDKDETIRRSVCKGICILLLFLIVIFIYAYKPARHISIGVFNYARATVNPQFHNETLKLRQAGLPASLADFDRDPPPSDSVNSAIVYALISSSKDPTNDEPEAKGKSVITDLIYAQAVKRYIAAHKDLFKLVHQAVSRTDYYVSYSNASNPLNIKYNETKGCRRAARLVRIESLDMAKSGDALKAAENQSLGFRIADHSAKDIGYIGLNSVIAADGITLRGLQDIMAVSHGKFDVAQAVLKSLDKSYHSPNLKSACISQLAESCSEVNYYLIVYRRNPMFPIFDNNGVEMIGQMKRAIDASELPYKQSKSVFEKIHNEASSKGGLSLIYVPNGLDILNHVTEVYTQAAITRAAANVFIYKSKYGSYPQTLNQAMSTVPIDPFSDKPLQYRREGKGFVVYSVGETGTYDGKPLQPTYHISPTGKKVMDGTRREYFYQYEE